MTIQREFPLETLITQQYINPRTVFVVAIARSIPAHHVNLWKPATAHLLKLQSQASRTVDILITINSYQTIGAFIPVARCQSVREDC